MIIQNIPEVIPSGYRIQIEELDEFEDSDDDQKV